MEENMDRLFAGFPPVSSESWETRIREDLKGADYDKKLVWKTPEGFKVKPFYSADDLKSIQYLDQLPGTFPFVRGYKTRDNAWEVRQDFMVTDIAATLGRAGIALGNGVNSIGFDITGKENFTYDNFKELIRNIDFDHVSLNLLSAGRSPDILEFLVKSLTERDIPTEKVRGSLNYDILGHLTTTGGFYISEKEDFIQADKLLLTAVNELPAFRILPVNSYYFGNAGASAVQELAFGLSMSAEYLVRLAEMGHDIAEIARHIQWNLGVGSSYFMEIAKIRAARLLFSNLLSAFDVRPDHPVFINSVTTDWNKTLYDAHVNILRLTTESMAAVLGGCNSLLVKPFDSWYSEPGNFSERISRNIQFILKEESYLDKVVDPAAGSYYIETLTDSLIEHAWQLFLKTDASGGYINAFKSGFIQDQVKTVTEQRHQMVASRREILLGTNQYPNFREAMKDGIMPEIAFPAPVVSSARVAEPVKPGRAASEFEKLRLAAESFPGGKPRVFMLTYGNLAMRLARAQFAGNFFACGGYEVIDNLGFKTAGEGVEAAMKAKAQIIVVCSSDEEYLLIAPAVFKKTGGKALVVVAGAPSCMEDLKEQGISEFIHLRSNVLETLRHFHQKLGIDK